MMKVKPKGKRFLACSPTTNAMPEKKAQSDGRIPLSEIKPTDRQIDAGRRQLLPKKPKPEYLSCIQFKDTDRPNLRELLGLDCKDIIRLSALTNVHRMTQRNYRMVAAAGIEQAALVLKFSALSLQRVITAFENMVLLRAEELGLPPFRPRVKVNTNKMTDEQAQAEHLAEREKKIRASASEEDRWLRQQDEDAAQAVKAFGVGNVHGEFKQSANRTFQSKKTRGFHQFIRSGTNRSDDAFEQQNESKGVDFDHSDDSFFND